MGKASHASPVPGRRYSPEAYDLIDCRVQLDEEINDLNDPAERSGLMDYYVRKLNIFEVEYRSCTAELRRRHPLYAT